MAAKHKYLVWHPDNYIEFITVTKDQPDGDGTAEVRNHESNDLLAKVVCHGNGFRIEIDDEEIELTYAEANFIAQAIRALGLASNNPRNRLQPEFFELKAVDDVG